MSAKKTPIPLPASKPKKTKVPPPKSSLSKELVGRDDDSSTESAPKAKKAEKPKATIGVHRPNGAANSSTKDKSTSKSAAQTKPAPKKPAPKTISKPEHVAELSSSEISDNSDAPARDIPTKLPGEVEMKDASSDSDSDSDSGSESDSSSEEEEAAKPAPKPAQATTSKPVEVELRAAKPYQPPKGYNLVSEKDRTGSKAAKIFDNLQGKQVWHITVPAGVSLKELQTIAMDKAMKGDSILNQKGTDYGFSTTEKSEDGPREILVPGKNGYGIGMFIINIGRVPSDLT
jgi:hypothetical protein